MINIILASASPRRKEILENALAIKPEIIISGIEESVDITKSPGDLVLDLAFQKGEAVAEAYKESLVISGDTIVSLKRNILGKPKNESDAIAMLKSLSGQCHRVYTGHCAFL
ncbi:hypothetical protein AZF37_05865 [endosymbiont 'TC1' of Trimyema compressum]|uniref:Maf family protein n=1 Tax=endosymbiont 'TC1' of Trimyema compressum TaxID=243899 RepID=UPI0007F0F2FF|nr:Maf family protein [endosymbiont 'TC1' of Trimyema compressum]AMP20766.1 hypothetical protein AZF37_05865 [endosymbiont 'TC1' of Trimyema compressum]